MKKGISVCNSFLESQHILREGYGPASLCIPIINPIPEVPTEPVTMHTVYTVLLLSLMSLPKENTLILLTVKAL